MNPFSILVSRQVLTSQEAAKSAENRRRNNRHRSGPNIAHKRFLSSCIGKPWAKVHSELSRKLDRCSVAGSHIWDHIMWEIETDCYIGPGRVAYSNRRRWVNTEAPVDGLYVHPKTGLIREQRRRGRLR